MRSLPHPYQSEIDSFIPDMSSKEPQMPHKLDDVPFTLVENGEQLREVIAKMESSTEIAIDLEHHAQHTY